MLTNLNILLIEDSTELRQNITAVLHMHNAIVVSAPDGRTGLAMALENPPDVIITDLEMPHFDGALLIRTLRSSQQTAHVPIMAMSGDIISLMQCPDGCIRLSKPFRVERFVQLINEAARQRNSNNSAYHA